MWKSQRGIILILVLWFIVLATVLVMALATETRLSAQVVMRNKEALEERTDLLKALRMAEMELILSRMPEPVKENARRNQEDIAERKNPLYQFDGRPLKLSYPEQPENVTIRIYDHSGKLNIRRLTSQLMRELLIKQMGENSEELAKLDAAWQDWVDSDDLERPEGAEKDYYEKLEPPYQPRNGLIETLDELLMIRGFDKAFKNKVLENCFTIYGSSAGINPNLATREVLELIPGLDGKLIDEIIKRRQEEEFKTNQDFNEFMDIDQLNKFLPWVNFTTGTYYTIALQVKPRATIVVDEKSSKDGKKVEKIEPPASVNDAKQPQRAYLVTVQFTGINQIPKVMRVDPYGFLPEETNTPIEELKENKKKFL